MPQKEKQPQKTERSPRAAAGRTVDIARVVQQALPMQGLGLPRPFGRVEGGVYSVNEDLTRALRFARSLPGQASAPGNRTADQAPEDRNWSHSVESARRWYAEELRFTARVSSPSVIEAFASVPRERFVGPGRGGSGVQSTWTSTGGPRMLIHVTSIMMY